MVRRVAYTLPGEMDLYMPHAHSQYLQTAAELGVVGMAAGLVAFGSVAWLLMRALRSGAPSRRRWAWASVFGLVFLALNVVVDVHTIVTVPLLLAIPIAVLDATRERGLGLPTTLRSWARPLRAIALGALLVGSVAALLYLARLESVALQHQRAVSAVAQGEWSDAVVPASEAAAADSQIGAYQLTAALAAAATGDWEAAEMAFRAVTEIDGLPTAWLGLGAAQAELGRQLTDVDASLTEARRLGVQQPGLMVAVGQVYDRVGLTDEADDAYAQTLGLDPGLAADADWRATLGDARFASIVDRAVAAQPAQAWEIALMAGDEVRARALALEQADSVRADRFIDAWTGDPEAIAEIQAAADAEPLDAVRLAEAARVSDRAGDEEAATKYRRLARLGPHYGPSTLDARFGLRDPSRDAATGTSTYYYGTYTYRRAMPVDLLVPGLPGMVIPGDPGAAATEPPDDGS
jgi:tetratricopeptide (TPR) repeat protein